MTQSNTEIANNIINLLNKVKENEAFDDNIDKKEQIKLFNKIVKAGIKGQTKINIKSLKKEPSKYNIFVREIMPSVKEENPNLSGAERFKLIGPLWTKDHPKETYKKDKTDNIKETNKTKKTDNIKETKETDNIKETKETDNIEETDKTDNIEETDKTKETDKIEKTDKTKNPNKKKQPKK
tara:strand:- start:210 stop:752 length:543 start_codon:yes stop_codon:yes gene_type:complete